MVAILVDMWVIFYMLMHVRVCVDVYALVFLPQAFTVYEAHMYGIASLKKHLNLF